MDLNIQGLSVHRDKTPKVAQAFLLVGNRIHWLKANTILNVAWAFLPVSKIDAGVPALGARASPRIGNK